MAARGALLYFIVDSLYRLDRVYHYSMANFVATLTKGALLGGWGSWWQGAVRNQYVVVLI